MPHIKPYGAWPSPVPASLLASKPADIDGVYLASDHRLYWLESRPQQGGRYALMRLDSGAGQPVEVTPSDFNVRTRVHEYGGAPYLVTDQALYFSHYGDHHLYAMQEGQAPQPITRSSEMRYADLGWDASRRRIIAVREDHRRSDIFAINTIVAIDPDSCADGQILVDGFDFFMYPRLSPDGSQLAWVAWNHPNMPWDGTELWVGDMTESGEIKNARRVAGGPTESVVEPSWSPAGELYYISDVSGWWNLYRIGRDDRAEAIWPRQAEFSQPAWVFGLSSYGFCGDTLIARYTESDRDFLAAIDTRSLQVSEIATPYATISSLCTQNGQAVFVGESFDQPMALVALDPHTFALSVVRSVGELGLDPADISVPEAMEFPTEHGQTAHLWYYPPVNHAVQAPADEKPPLIVFTHGGPTSNSRGRFRLEIQYWTTRGFAVADVNYRGSSGYGTRYRRLLNQSWGIVDVEDCCNAALYLAEMGRVDPHRLAIRGGSAGGYTTLACLTFRDVFHAGASYFGVSDLAGLAQETHKFESRYMDSMVGPWPETRERYAERSPLKHVDQIRRPIIFFQGLDDKIVLPNQAEGMVEELKRLGVPVAYLAFEGEGHGFHRADTIIRAAEAELYFYAQVFGIALPQEMVPVDMANWPQH